MTDASSPLPAPQPADDDASAAPAPAPADPVPAAPAAVDPEPDDAAPEPVADAAPEPVGAPVDAPRAEPEPEPGATFASLGLRQELLDALSALGYEEPTPIQREAIPPLALGHDLLGQAATGTGKTAAFALPILDALAPGRRERDPSALVLVPTRELAVQVSEALHKYGKAIGARVLPIYGGQPIVRQIKALDRGVDVVVATPGRALDHVRRGRLRLAALDAVVLDEADEMLDMGFAEDIEALLQETPDGCQTVLFSATMPPRIETLAKGHLVEPVRIQIARETHAGDQPLVRQRAHLVARAHKPAALGRVLDVEAPTAAIVFCRTRDEVDVLTETLNGRGYRAEALHGGMTQEQRDRVMDRLRRGTTELLIATDVAARGLDVEQLTHVVNYDVPSSPESYVHRIGRVGRAGREGAAITLAEPREHRYLRTIERVTRQRIPVERLPSVADLHARRLEVTRSALEEALAGDEQAEAKRERFRVVVEALADEHDIMDVALAAIALVDEAQSGAAGEAEQEIPDVQPRPDRQRGPAGPGGRGPGGYERGGRPGAGGPGGPRGGAPRRLDGPTTRLFVGVGRSAGVRPQDLVGAITGEAGLTGKQVGAIEIQDRFSLVEVPVAVADHVVAALRAGTIKGKRANVRRERYERGSGDGGEGDGGDGGGGGEWRPREGGPSRKPYPPRRDRR